MREFIGIDEGDIRVVKSRFPSDDKERISINYQVINRGWKPISFRIVETLPDGMSPDDVVGHPPGNIGGWEPTTDGLAIAIESALVVEGQRNLSLTVPSLDGDGLEVFLQLPTVYKSTTPTNHRPSSENEPGPPPFDDPLPSRQGDLPRGDHDVPSFPRPLASRSGPSTTTRSLVVRLREELASGQVDDAEIEALRSRLGLNIDEGQQIRQRFIQSKLTELNAFVDEFERFIDSAGRPIDVLESIEKRMDNLDDRMHRTESAIETLRNNTDALCERVNAIDAENDELVELSEDIEALQGNIKTLQEFIDVIDTKHIVRREELESQIESLTRWQHRISSAFEAIEREFSRD